MLDKSYFSFEGAVANRGGAVEFRDHFKNGASSKSLKSRIMSLIMSDLAKITTFTIAFLLIFSGCTNDAEKNLDSYSIVADCFTSEEIKDLTKLLDFFIYYICVSEGIDKKVIISRSLNSRFMLRCDITFAVTPFEK
jgi:hypothetical protein